MEGIIATKELQELSAYFNTIKAPPGKIELFPGTTITDIQLFIDSHLSILQPGNTLVVQRPALDRLMRLKEILANAS